MTSRGKPPKFTRATHNKMGWMCNPESDNYIREFIKFARSTDGVLADLGCAYGCSTKKALDGGTAKIIANDLDECHLLDLWNELNARPDLQSRLEIRVGDALEQDFEPGSLSGILAANWLHFLPPEDVRTAFGKFAGWLREGGKLFVVTVSTHIGSVKSAHRLIQERKNAGAEWPGLLRREDFEGHDDNIPETILCMDPDILEREAVLAGLEIVNAGYSARDGFEMPEAANGNGREFSGLIANKPG